MAKTTRNPVTWFEIPVTDMERAMAFYEAVLGTKLERHNMGPLDMAWFPWKQELPGAAGALVKHPDWYKPSTEGSLVYFSSPSGDLTNELRKVEAAGGKVLQEKKSIGEHGAVGFFMDTEGNRIALHSM